MTTLTMLAAMKHSPVRNYGGIPGLTSWLIGAPSEHGLVRLMECSRDHQEPIIPHSHRFDFHCIVLTGRVRNIKWVRSPNGGDYQESTLAYGGKPGVYVGMSSAHDKWATVMHTHSAGCEYSMRADEVHSIFFSRDTSVLFFEGPKVSNTSIILEPVVDGVTVPTFVVPEWAFKVGAQP
jgi:hypothetical protein